MTLQNQGNRLISSGKPGRAVLVRAAEAAAEEVTGSTQTGIVTDSRFRRHSGFYVCNGHQILVRIPRWALGVGG